MKKTQVNPTLRACNGINKEIGIEQKETDCPVTKVRENFQLVVINTDKNQDKGIAKEKKVKLFIKNRRRRGASIPGCAEQAGKGHGGDKEEDDHHDPIKIMNKSSVESKHDKFIVPFYVPVDQNTFPALLLLWGLLLNRHAIHVQSTQ